MVAQHLAGRQFLRVMAVRDRRLQHPTPTPDGESEAARNQRR
jgi:hypothetical protein